MVLNLKTLAVVNLAIAGVHATSSNSIVAPSLDLQDPKKVFKGDVRALAEKCNGWPGSVSEPRDMLALGDEGGGVGRTCTFSDWDVTFKVSCTEDVQTLVQDGTLTAAQAAWVAEVRAANLGPLVEANIPSSPDDAWKKLGVKQGLPDVSALIGSGLVSSRADLVNFIARRIVPECCDDRPGVNPTGRCWAVLGNLQKCDAFTPTGVANRLDFATKLAAQAKTCRSLLGEDNLLSVMGVNGLAMIQTGKIKFTENCSDKDDGLFRYTLKKCCMEKCLKSEEERVLEATATKGAVYVSDDLLGKRCLSRGTRVAESACIDKCVSEGENFLSKPATAEPGGLAQLSGAGASSSDDIAAKAFFAQDAHFSKVCAGLGFQAAAQCQISPCQSCMKRLFHLEHDDTARAACEAMGEEPKVGGHFVEGDKIKFEGTVFLARWWTKDLPNSSNVGKKNTGKVWGCECTFGDSAHALCAYSKSRRLF